MIKYLMTSPPLSPLVHGLSGHLTHLHCMTIALVGQMNERFVMSIPTIQAAEKWKK
jgi:hypothetical protein